MGSPFFFFDKKDGKLSIALPVGSEVIHQIVAVISCHNLISKGLCVSILRFLKIIGGLCFFSDILPLLMDN